VVRKKSAQFRWRENEGRMYGEAVENKANHSCAAHVLKQPQPVFATCIHWDLRAAAAPLHFNRIQRCPARRANQTGKHGGEKSEDSPKIVTVHMIMLNSYYPFTYTAAAFL
jgi:hypothetical protein